MAPPLHGQPKAAFHGVAQAEVQALSHGQRRMVFELGVPFEALVYLAQQGCPDDEHGAGRVLVDGLDLLMVPWQPECFQGLSHGRVGPGVVAAFVTG